MTNCVARGGTGRFEGAFTSDDGAWQVTDSGDPIPPPAPFSDWFEFLLTGRQVDFIALFLAPRLGSYCDQGSGCHNGVLLKGTFSARSEEVAVAGEVCSGGRLNVIHLAGVVQGIGKSTAQLDYCKP